MRIRPAAAKIALWSILAAAVAGIAYFSFFRPAPPVRTVTVVIKPGVNTAQIAEQLAKAGVVANAYTFRSYATLTQTEAALQPGRYRLKTDLTYFEILKELSKRRKEELVQVAVPEGYTGAQIAQRLAKETNRPADDFYEFIRGRGVPDVRPDGLPPEVTTIEGYLFPKTYTFRKKEHPKKMIARMVEQYRQEISGIDWSYAQEKNLTRHQIMTIASIIEAEAKVPEERSQMAAVIYNRLAKAMPLQMCSTVQYAMPKRKEVLTEEDLKIASPYNTYQQIGLPPGPIANPGIDSIKAALAPATVDYLYFVLTSPDGHHTFTNNYNEFLAAKRRAGQ